MIYDDFDNLMINNKTNYDLNYYLKHGHQNDNIGTVTRHLNLLINSQNVLVAPCGYGQIVNHINGNYSIAYGIDISEEMIKRKIHENVKLGDIRDIKHSDNEFDLIFCCDLLEHFDEHNILKSLFELERVCKNDGYLVVRVGTDDLECFNDDLTHITKENDKWWINIIESNTYFKLDAYCTAIGEYIFKKNKKAKLRIKLEKEVKDYIRIKNDMIYFNIFKRPDNRIECLRFNRKYNFRRSLISYEKMESINDYKIIILEDDSFYIEKDGIKIIQENFGKDNILKDIIGYN